MQLMPATAATFGVTNRFEIEQNIRGGVAYLARLLKLFDGDLRLVAAAYLTGENRILPTGLAYSNAEVYRYVSNVARLYRKKRLKHLQTEGSARNEWKEVVSRDGNEVDDLDYPVLELAGRAHGQQAAQVQVQPQIVGRPIRDGQVTTVFLAPRYVTAIRMPEPVNSVVVGDPASFSAEHSDREPNLVFVKPITPKAAQTNLLISSTRGLQASLLLISRGEPKEEGQPAVDFLMRYKPAGQFMIQPRLSIRRSANRSGRQRAAVSRRIRPICPPRRQLRRFGGKAPIQRRGPDALDELDRQRLLLPVLYGQKPGIATRKRAG
jgi:hypothetical protein